MHIGLHHSYSITTPAEHIATSNLTWYQTPEALARQLPWLGGLCWAPPVVFIQSWHGCGLCLEYVEQCNMLTFNEPLNHVTILNQWPLQKCCLKSVAEHVSNQENGWEMTIQPIRPTSCLPVTWVLNARRRLVIANARFQIYIYIYIHLSIYLCIYLSI